MQTIRARYFKCKAAGMSFNTYLFIYLVLFKMKPINSGIGLSQNPRIWEDTYYSLQPSFKTLFELENFSSVWPNTLSLDL